MVNTPRCASHGGILVYIPRCVSHVGILASLGMVVGVPFLVYTLLYHPGYTSPVHRPAHGYTADHGQDGYTALRRAVVELTVTDGPLTVSSFYSRSTVGQFLALLSDLSVYTLGGGHVAQRGSPVHHPFHCWLMLPECAQL